MAAEARSVERRGSGGTGAGRFPAVMSLPNFLSFARLLSVPVIVWLLVDAQRTAAFWLFVLAGLTDGIDGFLAKRFNWKTELGAYLDPLADKALVVALYVTLGRAGDLPRCLAILSRA